MKTKQVTIEGAIYFDTDSLTHEWADEYKFFAGTMHAFVTFTPIVPYTITVDIPADFDPRPAMVKALEEKKEKARAEFAARVVELDRQINELLAIEG